MNRLKHVYESGSGYIAACGYKLKPGDILFGTDFYTKYIVTSVQQGKHHGTTYVTFERNGVTHQQRINEGTRVAIKWAQTSNSEKAI